MSKMIQIRNVPDDVHRTIKERAARTGMTLSDYLKRDLERQAARPAMDEFLQQLEADGRISIGADTIVEIVHEGRERR